MKRTSNKNCAEFIGNLIPFKGSNLHSEWIDNFYVVFSYAWYPLFVYDNTEKKAYLNEKRYSASTSRQALHIGHKLIWMSYEMSEELFNKFKRKFNTVLK